MAERKLSASRAETNLAKVRLDLGVTQVELAKAAGLGVRTIQELERGEITNPPIGYLINVATALGVELMKVCEPEWVQPFKYESGALRRTTERVEKAKLDPGRFRHLG